MAKRFDRVIGLDLLPEGAQTLVREMNLTNVEIRKADEGFKLDFEDGSVSMLVAADVLEHLRDRQPILREIKRVLEPGGVFVLTGPTENLIYRFSRRVVFWFFGKKHDHFTNVYQLEKEVAEHLKIEKRWVLPNRLIQGFVVLSARK